MKCITVSLIETDLLIASKIIQKINTGQKISCLSFNLNIEDFVISKVEPEIILVNFELIKHDLVKAISLLNSSGCKLVFYSDKFDKPSICNSLSFDINGLIYLDELLASFELICNIINEVGGYYSQSITLAFINKLQSGNRELLKFSELQRKIINLLIEGYSYQEIAELSKKSINTVRFHVRKIYKELNINSKMQLLNVSLQ